MQPSLPRTPSPRALLAALAMGLVSACYSPNPALVESQSEPGVPPVNVGFLLVDGVYNTELMAPWDVFHHTIFHTEPGMRLFTVAPDDDVVTTFEGLALVPEYTFEQCPKIDILVVPSTVNSMDSDLEDRAQIAWVRERGNHARFVVSLCDGAFVLAGAGLLDGRQATTFPSDIERMREDFPEVTVLDGPSFVHDGNTLTSVGGAQSYDAALYLTELLYGDRVARAIAGGLCIDWNLDDVEHVLIRKLGQP